MKKPSIFPLLWSYIFLIIGFILLASDYVAIFSKEVSILIGVGVIIYFIISLQYTKPYVYSCGFLTSLILILLPGGIAVYFFKEGSDQFILLLFSSLSFFNFIVFFIFKLFADFSEFENNKIKSETNNGAYDENSNGENPNLSTNHGNKEFKTQGKINACFFGALKGGIGGYIGGWFALFIISSFYSNYLIYRDEYTQLFDASVVVSFLFLSLHMLETNVYRNIGDIPFREIVALLMSTAIFGILSPLIFWGVLSIILGADKVTQILNSTGEFFASATLTGIVLGILFEFEKRRKQSF